MSVPFTCYLLRPLFVEIANGDKLAETFTGERCMKARVLRAQMSNADDCSAKHLRMKIRGQRLEVSIPLHDGRN